MNYILIGNKYNNFKNINNLIDLFKNNTRFNMSLPNKNNGTKYDKILLNCHMHSSLSDSIKNNINRYNTHFSIPEEYIKIFFNNVKNYKTIKRQYFGNNIYSNNILKDIGCKLKLKKLPRVGFQEIIYQISQKIFPCIIGFSLQVEDCKHIAVIKQNYISNTHDKNNEMEILVWLHNNNFIDATLCMLTNENSELLELDCSVIYPKLYTINLIFQCINEIFLKNYELELIKNIIKDNENIILIEKENKLTIK